MLHLFCFIPQLIARTGRRDSASAPYTDRPSWHSRRARCTASRPPSFTPPTDLTAALLQISAPGAQTASGSTLFILLIFVSFAIAPVISSRSPFSLSISPLFISGRVFGAAVFVVGLFLAGFVLVSLALQLLGDCYAPTIRRRASSSSPSSRSKDAKNRAFCRAPQSHPTAAMLSRLL